MYKLCISKKLRDTLKLKISEIEIFIGYCLKLFSFHLMSKNASAVSFY